MPDDPPCTAARKPSTGADRMPLFRVQAVESLHRRWFGPVQVATPPSVCGALLLALTALSMLALAMLTVEIPERIRAVGVLLPVDGLLKLRAPRAGRVDRLGVRNGDAVYLGQVLLRLSGLEQAPGQQPEPAARIASLHRELELLDQTLAGELTAVEARVGINQRRLRLMRERIRVAEVEQQMREREAGFHDARAGRVTRLATEDLVAEHVVDEVSAAALGVLATGYAVRQRVLSLQDELLAIEQQLAADRMLPGILRRQAGLKREAIMRDIAAGRLQSAIEIRAPESGIVAGLGARVGEYVASGDVLMTLHDPDSTLEARLYLRPANAGMITRGQRVELQLEAYPHEFFGTQTAIVKSVSPVAVPVEEIDPGVPFNGPVFEVRAKLRSSVLRARSRAWELPPGTSFTADLVRRRWPLYRWLLRPAAGDRPTS